MAIAGLGLIGGSLARALTRAGYRVIGADGKITTRLEGSFGLKAFEDALQTAP